MTSRSWAFAAIALGGLLGICGAPRAATAQPTVPAPSADAPRVAVVVQLAVNVDELRVDALAATLAEALGQALVVDAIGGGDVSRRLPPGDFPEDCIETPACVRDIGQRLDAQQLLVAVLVQVGDDLQIDVTWVDVATSRSVARPSIALAADAHAGKVFAEAAIRLLPDAQVRAQPGRAGGGLADGDERQPLRPVTSRRGRHLTKPAWITAAVGGAALIGAVGLGLSVRSLYHRCDDAAAGCSDDDLDALDRRALGADLCLGLAAGAAIATGVLVWRSGADERSGASPVEVRASGDGVTLVVGGRF